MKRNRIASLLLAAALLIGTQGGLWQALAADMNTIKIGTAEELTDFAKKCALDTWSQGKTALLTEDIDLSGSDFTPIPTFGGLFDGQGHKISGLSVTRNGSNQGLFRYVQESGVVQNLDVSGVVEPGGSAGAVGGVTGRNFGTLQNVAFNGTVAGKTNVGGVAGINEGSGQLIGCSASGMVSGEHYTGGVVGQNLGAAVSCRNRAYVNTHEEEVTLSLDEFNWEKVNSTENVSVNTDTGGVAGYSTGILQSCVNMGTVGYPHTGYNVGGIVGRQSGYLDGCVNRGTVYGRKDVGGIVGQMEPYMLLTFDEDSLQKLDTELDSLRAMMRQLGDTASLTGDQFSSHADALSDQLEQVRNGAHDVANWTTDFVDGTVDTVNEFSARLSRTVDRMESVFDDFGDAGDDLGRSFDRISDLFDDLEDAIPHGADAASDATDAFESLGDAMDSAHRGGKDVREALEALQGAVGDPDALAEAAAQLQSGLRELKSAGAEAQNAIDELTDAIKELQNAGGVIGNTGELEPQLEALQDAIRQMNSALSSVGSGAAAFIPALSGGVNGENVTQSINSLRAGLQEALNAASSIRGATGSVSDAFNSVEVFAKATGPALTGASKAFGQLEDAADSMTSGLRELEDIFSELADEEKLEMPALNSDYTTRVDDIFDSLDSVSSEVGGMRGDLSSSGDQLHSDARAVSDQLGVVSDLLMDGYNDAFADEDEDRIEDISDTDTTGSQGRALRSINYGTIEGDVNVGGVAGSMAIEYDLDPEDDIVSDGKRSMNFRYQTRAAMNGCVNWGEVIAKKNYAGGLIGRMDLGSVSACEGYGSVTSTDGGYVGGIAGASYATIRESWAKCALEGEEYVGGIAGLGSDVIDSRAMVTIDAEGECLGAIAGDADGTVARNYFVSDDLAGVDGVSYAGKAEPQSYDALMAAVNLPSAFRTFTVTFLLDGEVLGEVSVGYGESLDAEDIPEIPAREGQYGEWSDDDFTELHANKIVEAVYAPYITLLESGMESEGRPLLLAEGNFDGHAALALEEAADAPSGAPGTAMHAVVTHEAAAEGDSHVLRALAAEEDSVVWIVRDGKWRKTDSVRDGSYLVFTAEGDDVTYCVGRQVNQVLTIVLAAGIAGLVCAAALRHRDRRKKCAKKAKSEEKTEKLAEKETTAV